MAKLHLKPIPGFRGYFASSDGDIWSIRPGRWGNVRWKKRKSAFGRDGYLDVVLFRSDGKKCNKSVHSLVALAWHGPRPRHLIVTHLDGTRTNNKPSNLAHRTPRENCLDKLKHGTMSMGEKHPRSKLTDEQCHEIRLRYESGERQTDLAKEFGVCPSTVWAMRTGRGRSYLNLQIH